MTQSGFEDLEALVTSAIREERIGIPRFLRCIATVSDSTRCAVIRNALLALAMRCFGSEPDRQDRGESPGNGVDILLARWAGGEGALIWLAPSGRVGKPGLDLMLLGSRGALYHEGPLEGGAL